MFAILFSDKMDPFYKLILSFPTVIFTCLLVLCVLFWCVAILGMIDIDALDVDVDPDIDGGDIDGADGPGAVSAVLMKLGLNDVPLTLVITLITLIGWLISYFISYFLYDLIPDGILEFVAGLVILVFTVYVSSLITAKLIKPLRPMFKKMDHHVEKLVMGQTAVVRTSRVDEKFGEANFDDGGAGLILKVRASNGNTYKRGDRVVLIEHLQETGAFRVVSEEEFQGL